MGTGIAIVAARYGNLPQTQIIDVSEDTLIKSRTFIENWLNKELKKGRVDEKLKADVLNRITFSTQLESVNDTDFVVEAVNESFALKEYSFKNNNRKIFKQLDQFAPSHAILASNTSSISLTKIASVTKRPEQVVGMHFFNPVPVMNLVEIISAIQTSDATRNLTQSIATSFGKEIVHAKDVPGFIANRVLMPWINEAVFTLQEGIASIEDIDKAMKLGTNVPMGPLTLADFIGLDTYVRS